MSKQIIYWEDSRKKMFSWIETVAKTVIVTMGPKGRNVILETKKWNPLITNDGVTIAREISLEDSFENMGAQLVKDAAEKTNSLAGDGTTTATLLTYAIAQEWQKQLQRGVNAVELKNGLHKAWILVTKELEKNAKKINSQEEIAQVATISAQDSYIGEIIAEAMNQVWNTGVISVEEGQTFGLEVEITEWMEFDQGYMSPYMVNNSEKMLAEFLNAPILITDQKISNMKQLLPLLEEMMKKNMKDLIILAEDIEADAMTTIVLNKLKWILNILAIKAPWFGEAKKDIIKDIAIITGANIITWDLAMKLENTSLDDLGKAKTVISSQQRTTIIWGMGDSGEIKERVEEIKKAISLSDNSLSTERLSERLAKLDWWVAVIKVWAASEIEMKEKKLRIEDALNATRAAIEEWVVAGGWIALLKASNILKWISFANPDQDLAIEIIRQTLLYPAKQIAKNAGKDETTIINTILENTNINYWYDAADDHFIDMIEAWIIDPKKVSRIALEQAISLSGMFLTTEAAITSIPKKEEFSFPALPDMGAMPMM